METPVDRTRQSSSAMRPRLSSLYFRLEQIDRAIHALETFQSLRARRSHATDNAFAVTRRFRSRNRAGNRQPASAFRR
jgi:hypothetical protein